MAFNNSSYPPALVFLMLALAFPGVAEARKGVLKRADDIAFRAQYPETSQQKVRCALTQTGITFLEGHWTLISSTLKFAGDTKSFNNLLASLNACDETTMKIGFEKLDASTDWIITHLTGANHFHIVVNSQSKRIRLNELEIPPIPASRSTDDQKSKEQIMPRRR